ncbi:MAG: acetyl-CoA carboxylase biotin carboxyl carrier protein, partial [Thermoguttaceae bacterium]
AAATPPPVTLPSAEQAGPGEAAAKSANMAVIKSPVVGTFYPSPDPDSAPYVKVGDHVGNETTVCIVEAMKVFNQIPAEVSGKVIAVLAESGEPVEFGQPLFKVDTTQ